MVLYFECVQLHEMYKIVSCSQMDGWVSNRPKDTHIRFVITLYMFAERQIGYCFWRCSSVMYGSCGLLAAHCLEAMLSHFCKGESFYCMKECIKLGNLCKIAQGSYFLCWLYTFEILNKAQMLYKYTHQLQKSTTYTI